jgi:16S rRNA (guanine966-N2)-methyltransferase
MRIVGGELRGRPLAAPEGREIRPTSDRLRETLFDILIHRFGDPVSGARVLDLFAGTGALGLEALSRGAAWCLFVEDGVEARGLIRANAEAIGVTGRTRIFRRDATGLGPIGNVAPFSLVFADPPYGRDLGEKALASARDGGWLVNGALCVLEEAAASKPGEIAGFHKELEREIGQSHLTVFSFALPA